MENTSNLSVDVRRVPMDIRTTKLVICKKNNEPIRYDKRVECKRNTIRENAITFSLVHRMIFLEVSWYVTTLSTIVWFKI